jgi:hypothetical protein
VLVKVTDCDALVVPYQTGPKDIAFDESETIGGEPPMPDNAMLCGDPMALSVIVTAAAISPAAVGAKCP